MNFEIITRKIGVAAVLSFGAISSVFSQTPAPRPTPPASAVATPPPPPIVAAASPLDAIFARRAPDPPAQMSPVTVEKRRQAYAKLLEAQRYMWTIKNRRVRSQSALAANVKPAYEALLSAVELNPGFSEAYTALAELVFLLRNDSTEAERLLKFSEVERLSKAAVRFNADNFGAHQFLAQIYTLQSKLNEGNLDQDFADKAIAEWQEIVRLDPRSAEGWAFLSDFYERTGKTDKAIEALRRWSGAASPMDGGFYRYVTQGGEASPDAAAVRLGRALFRSGATGEAIAILSRAVIDEPQDDDALLALNDAIEAAGEKDAALAIEALQQAVYNAPTNSALLEILANAQLRAKQLDEAAKTLRTASQKLAASDRKAAANLLVKLGEIYAAEMRDAEALATYEQALSLMSVANLPVQTETEREFAAATIPRLVALHKQAGRTNEARNAIARLRSVLGKDDSTADAQFVEFLLGIGDREAALAAARDARARFPEDAALLRLEASVLTDLGRVDEAVTLMRSKIINKSKQIAVPQALIPDFLAHLTISNLYVQAGRAADAIGAARQALDLAQTDEMTRIGLMTLATAQNASGDFRAAEASLRDVLKQEPDNATALNNLGYFLVERGERLPEAIDLIKRAVRSEPNNASFLDSLGWAHFKSNQLVEAEKYLTEAARRNPDSATIQDHLGDLLQRKGKPEEARAAWRKALSFTSDPAEVKKIRAKIGDKK